MTLTQDIAQLTDLVAGLQYQVTSLGRQKSSRGEELRTFHSSRMAEQERYDREFLQRVEQLGAPGSNKVRITKNVCKCRSHYAVDVFQLKGSRWRKTASSVCPIAFWLFQLRCFTQKDDWEGFERFRNAHPLPELLEKVHAVSPE